jgi:hypothetical protein
VVSLKELVRIQPIAENMAVLGGSENTSRGKWLRKSTAIAFPARGGSSVSQKEVGLQGAVAVAKLRVRQQERLH